jgi:hypothetical protein
MSRFSRQCFCPILALSLAACDGSSTRQARETEENPGPQVTKSGRTPREPTHASPAESLRQALVSADSLTEVAERDKALAKVAWDAIASDPELAHEALGKITPGSGEKIPLIQHLAMRLADGDVDAALEWASTLESEREAAAAHARIALVVADTDPARAAELLSEHGLANREFEVAVVQVLRHWVRKNPSDAAAWVAMFPPSEFRKEGLRSVVSHWIQNHPQAVFSWLSDQSDEGIRKEAVDAIVPGFLAQPAEIRETWLQYAGPQVRESFVHALRNAAE